MKILAIETSCDETAAAVIEVKSKSNQLSVIRMKSNTDNLITDNSLLSTHILSNVVASQINLHKKYGGVFPEIASRAHTEKIIPVVEQSLAESNQLSVIRMKTDTDDLITDNSLLSTIDCIAVTTGPGLIGSLLIGVNFAKTLAYTKNIPIIPINHLMGHIYSNFVGENSKFKIQNSKLPNFPSLVLIVSGGHTGLYLVKSHNDIKLLGQTLDDAAGEAFDKVAKLLGLGYPGGPSVSTAAEKFENYKIKNSMKIGMLPRSMLNSGDYNFSFSGLKTAVLYKVKKLTNHYPLTASLTAALAAEFQQAVVDILVGKTVQAAIEFKPKSICLCGGVSANKELREQLGTNIKKALPSASYHVPLPILSTDNAAMIGIAAAYHLNNKTTYDKISANANLKL